MTARPRPKPSEAGFGLVETLIAITIIAAMTAVTFQSIVVNARAMQAVEDRRAAVLVAKSALDAAVGGSVGIGGPDGGNDGRMHWQVTVTPFQSRLGNAPSLDLVTATVTVRGTDRPILQLRTLKIGR